MDLSIAKFLMIPVLVVGALFGLRNFSGEVATLYTTDGDGQAHTTRVWVVEHGHELWIRSLDPTSPWLDRLIKHPEVELRRGKTIADYRATPHTERRARVNDLMAQRYHWAEWILSRFEDRDEVVPVYLDPLD
jgi:hypothetical protein